jgi:hypothetical protein
VSDSQQGPDWWQANDDKWYPPERHPDYKPARDDRPPPPPIVRPTPAPEHDAGDTTAPAKKASGQNGCLLLVGVVALVIAAGWACTALSGESSSSYVATAEGEPANPASLTVFVEVTNTGDTTGTPECTVRASDPSSAYTGFDVFTLGESIGPGESSRFTGTIVITGQGAAYVTEITAECD